MCGVWRIRCFKEYLHFLRMRLDSHMDDKIPHVYIYFPWELKTTDLYFHFVNLPSIYCSLLWSLILYSLWSRVRYPALWLVTRWSGVLYYATSMAATERNEVILSEGNGLQDTKLLTDKINAVCLIETVIKDPKYGKIKR